MIKTMTEDKNQEGPALTAQDIKRRLAEERRLTAVDSLSERLVERTLQILTDQGVIPPKT